MIVRDQLNRSIKLENVPERIISLVPSLTELLCDLGLTDRLVGVTKFCIHPAGIKQRIQNIGGTKNVNFKRVKSLQPDLIIANKEENEREQVDLLAESYPVFITDIHAHDDTQNLIETLGKIFQQKAQFQKIIDQLQDTLKKISDCSLSIHPRVIYLIWRNPLMAAGGDTYISFMLDQMGFDNCLKESKRYPELSIEMIKNLRADYIFLSSEPYPFKEKHINEIESLTNTKCILVDGEFFSWYGSRIIHLNSYPSQLTSQL